MNFLDTYDISTGSAGSSTPPPNQPQQSLNEEVNQVIGQLGRFWGGFRKQASFAPFSIQPFLFINRTESNCFRNSSERLRGRRYAGAERTEQTYNQCPN